MKHRNFSLVELLVVIAVIGILAGIAIPVIGGAMEKGKRSKTQAQVMGIKTAVLMFEQDYSKLPSTEAIIGLDSGKCFSQYGTPDDNYRNFFNTLTYVDCTSGNKPTDTANKKGKRYLDVPKDYVGTSNSNNSIRDPWGRPYIVLLDTDYDEKITDADLLKGTVFQKVAVISVGPQDGTLTKTQIQEEIRKKKAVVSWE